MPTKMWPPDFSEIGLRVEFFSPAFDLNLTQSLKTEKQQLLQNLPIVIEDIVSIRLVDTMK